jgi:hypothetical protein
MPVRIRSLLTQRLDALPFLRAAHVVVSVVGLAAAAAILAGCTTASIDDATPSASSQSMLPETAPTPAEAQRGTATDPAAAPANPEIVDVPVETVAVPADPMSSAGPKNTGTFPNLNVKPATANTQITEEEKAAELQALRGVQAEHNATLATAGKDLENPVLLRKLAAKHAKDALKKIEGK